VRGFGRRRGALALGLEVGGDAIAGDLRHHVVVLVLVHERFLAGREAHFPDHDSIVLEELLRPDLADNLIHRILPFVSVIGFRSYRSTQQGRP
jgi:hypothetical protein